MVIDGVVDVGVLVIVAPEPQRSSLSIVCNATEWTHHLVRYDKKNG